MISVPRPGVATVHFDRFEHKWDKSFTISNFSHPSIGPAYGKARPRDRVVSKMFMRCGGEVVACRLVAWSPDWSCVRAGCRVLRLLTAQGDAGEARDFGIKQDSGRLRDKLGFETTEGYIPETEGDR